MSVEHTTVMKNVRMRTGGSVSLTKAGSKLMTLVGKCMEGGGSVDMDTYMKSDAEFANVTMVWRSEPPVSRELARLRSQKWKN